MIDPLERIRDANPISEADADQWFASATPPDLSHLPSGSGDAVAARPPRRAAAAWIAWSLAAAAVVLVAALVVGRGGPDGPDVVVATSTPVAGSTVPATTAPAPAETTTTMAGDVGAPAGSEGSSVPGLDALVAAHPEVFLGMSGGLDKPGVAVLEGQLPKAAPLLARFPADRFRIRECPITPAEAASFPSTVKRLMDPVGHSYVFEFNANDCTLDVVVGSISPGQIAALEAAAPSYYRFSSVATVARTTLPN